VEISVRTAGGQRVTADAALLRDAEPWILSVDGIELEAALAGTMLFFRNKDVPGVVGQVGTALGSREINISTFALGRRMDAQRGADAVALVRLDGDVPDSVVDAIRALPAVTEARLVRLAE
jgi:D-3-phosphoglycerate dehydrogenase